MLLDFFHFVDTKIVYIACFSSVDQLNKYMVHLSQGAEIASNKIKDVSKLLMVGLWSLFPAIDNSSTYTYPL